jgi:hypothetical protein
VGLPIDIKTFQSYVDDAASRSPTFKKLVTDIGGHSAPGELPVHVMLQPSPGPLDSFFSNQLTLSDLSVLPPVPLPGAQQAMTRTEALTHVLAERQYGQAHWVGLADVVDKETGRTIGYDEAHAFAILVENNVRAEMGQHAILSIGAKTGTMTLTLASQTYNVQTRNMENDKVNVALLPGSTGLHFWPEFVRQAQRSPGDEPYAPTPERPRAQQLETIPMGPIERTHLRDRGKASLRPRTPSSPP